MKLKLVIVLIGIILVFLGLLWFLQGTGLIQLCPILCFADCTCIKSGSQFWEIVGGITFVIGIVFLYSVKKRA